MNTQTLNVCNKGKLPKNNAHSVSQANEVSSLEPTVRSEFELDVLDILQEARQ